MSSKKNKLVNLDIKTLKQFLRAALNECPDEEIREEVTVSRLISIFKTDYAKYGIKSTSSNNFKGTTKQFDNFVRDACSTILIDNDLIILLKDGLVDPIWDDKNQEMILKLTYKGEEFSKFMYDEDENLDDEEDE